MMMPWSDVLLNNLWIDYEHCELESLNTWILKLPQSSQYVSIRGCSWWLQEVIFGVLTEVIMIIKNKPNFTSNIAAHNAAMILIYNEMSMIIPWVQRTKWLKPSLEIMDISWASF